MVLETLYTEWLPGGTKEPRLLNLRLVWDYDPGHFCLITLRL